MKKSRYQFPNLVYLVTAVCLLLASSLAARSLPDGNSLLPDGDALLRDAEHALQKYRSVQYVSRTAMQIGLAGAVHTSEKSFATVAPGRIRMESRSSGLTSLMVSDGVTTTAYNSEKYTHISGTMASMTTAMGFNAPDAGTDARSRTVGEETVEIDGRAYNCWVVETPIDGATAAWPQMGSLRAAMTGTMKTWIDRESRIDVRSSAAVTVAIAGQPPVIATIGIVKSQLRIDEPIGDAVFVFTPPPDATEVPAGDYISSLFGDFRGRTLTGKSAPAFELKGQGGSSYSLAGVSGHPVVLDFWATWCIPCRATIPILNDFYAKHQKDGIVVIGVNMDETADQVKKFADREGIRYPVALGADNNIGDSFAVSVFPTLVLIDPQGKIQSYEIGFDSEDSLRQILTHFSDGFAK